MVRNFGNSLGFLRFYLMVSRKCLLYPPSITNCYSFVTVRERYRRQVSGQGTANRDREIVSGNRIGGRVWGSFHPFIFAVYT